MFAIEKLLMIERKRASAAAKLAHANDNRGVERHAPATPARTALVGRWHKNEQTGRLEWHWNLELLPVDPEAPPCLPQRCAEDTPIAPMPAAGPGGQNCHPTVTQLDVVRRSAKATLIFARI
jgi:hypothetical protein